jgi:hypothetical protein
VRAHALLRMAARDGDQRALRMMARLHLPERSENVTSHSKLHSNPRSESLQIATQSE